MKYVLDTNTVSFLMRGDAAVVAALTALSRQDVLLPQPVVAEVSYGLARLSPSKRRTRLRERFDTIRREIKRAEWNDAVSGAFGDTKAWLEREGQRLEDLDVAVAAHAIAIEGTLVTDDDALLTRVPGLRVVNWRERSGGR